MTDLIANLGLGFQVALSPENLALAFVGCLLGTLIGVLPGIGPLPTFAMLLPITFYLPATGGLIMLAGVYYGAQYGGSTTAILMNLPGEGSSVVTTLDGYQMALQGRGGVALSIAALASLFAGCAVTLLIALAGPPLARIALLFGAAEYVAVILLGLICAILLAHGSALKAAAMLALGILLGLVGTDVNTGATRYTFGVPELADGIGFVPVAIGLFGIAEIICNIEETGGAGRAIARIASLWPTRADLRAAWPATLRGTAVGTLLGMLPGGGATISSFAAYSVEKKLSRDPSRFGQGAIEGVAAPEAANNAGAQATFIPMLILGLPANGLLALMMGAMLVHGITPGPKIMTAQPDLFWGLIVSMWIGNVMLVLLNLPLVGLWVRLLMVPYAYLFPTIVVLCAIGAYSIINSALEVYLIALFGIAGYLFRKFDCEPAPLLLGLILGPLLEEYLRRALVLSDGDWSIFLQRPIAATLLGVAAMLGALVLYAQLRYSRAPSRP